MFSSVNKAKQAGQFGFVTVTACELYVCSLQHRRLYPMCAYIRCTAMEPERFHIYSTYLPGIYPTKFSL